VSEAPATPLDDETLSGVLIPVDLPAGTVITITITIGPGRSALVEQAAPAGAFCPHCGFDLSLLPDSPPACPRCDHALL
jgi:hypothetical protein